MRRKRCGKRRARSTAQPLDRSQERDRYACRGNNTFSHESCSSGVVSVPCSRTNSSGRTPLKTLATFTLIAISAFGFAAAADPPTRYQVTKLTSDLLGAANQDPVLQNSWGVAFTPSGPFWIADNPRGVRPLMMVPGCRSHRYRRLFTRLRSRCPAAKYRRAPVSTSILPVRQGQRRRHLPGSWPASP